MASREISASDSPSAHSRHQVPDAAPDPEHVVDLDEGHAAGRGPKLVVASVGVAWVTMAVLVVTVFRPEARRGDARGGTGARHRGTASGPAPFADPAGYGGKPATPSPSSPSAPGQAQPSDTVKPPTATPTPAATATPDARPTSTPQPTASATSARTVAPSPDPSRGSTYPGLPSLGQRLLRRGERIINRLDHQGRPGLRVRPRVPLRPRAAGQQPSALDSIRASPARPAGAVWPWVAQVRLAPY